MAQGPSDKILVAIRITLRIRESKVQNPDLRIGGGLWSLSISSLHMLKNHAFIVYVTVYLL